MPNTANTDFAPDSTAAPARFGQTAEAPRALLVTCTKACAAGVLARRCPPDVALVRSPAALIPPCWGANQAISAALEEALAGPGDADIIVCGHSGCKSLQECPATTDQTQPRAPAGIESGGDPMRRMYANMRAAAALRDQACQHVVRQLRNLETYPAVRRALAGGRLRLHGWVYLDASGTILRYDPESERFTPLSELLPVQDRVHSCRQDWLSM